MHPYVHCSIIHGGQDMEQPVSFHRGLDKNTYGTYILWNTLSLKKDIDNNTLIVGDCNTPLSKMDRSSKQTISKDIVALNNVLDEME